MLVAEQQAVHAALLQGEHIFAERGVDGGRCRRPRRSAAARAAPARWHMAISGLWTPKIASGRSLTLSPFSRPVRRCPPAGRRPSPARSACHSAEVGRGGPPQVPLPSGLGDHYLDASGSSRPSSASGAPALVISIEMALAGRDDRQRRPRRASSRRRAPRAARCGSIIGAVHLRDLVVELGDAALGRDPRGAEHRDVGAVAATVAAAMGPTQASSSVRHRPAQDDDAPLAGAEQAGDRQRAGDHDQAGRGGRNIANCSAVAADRR